MHDDYYSYAPTHTLARPLALAGVPGADVGRTARALNLMTGIPFVWLDRRVEHEHGRSVELVQLEQGTEARLLIERRVIAEELQARTPSIFALSTVTMTDDALRARLLAEADVVVLDVGPEVAADRIFTRAEKDARVHWALRAAHGHNRDAVRDAIREAARPLADVTERLDVTGMEPLSAAEALVPRWLSGGR